MKTFRKLVKNPISLIGLIIVLFFTFIAVAAPWLAPAKYPDEPYKIPRDGFKATPKPPSPEHPFGTSEGQYDIYYGVVWGTRTAFRVGLIVTGGIALIGIILGSISAYFGGIIDEAMMRILEIFMAFPFLVAAMVLSAILGKGLNNVMIALIVFGWTGYARLIRGDILQIKENDYVNAAKGVGATHFRRISKHIIPNAIYPVFIMASMDIGSMVLAVSALSFLGLGAEVGYADWGQMISFARNWILGTYGNPLAYWYTVVYPGGAILLFVLGWNLLGDAFRDILDPRMRGVRGE